MLKVAREILLATALWQIWSRLGVQDVRLRFKRSAIGPAWVFLNLAVMIIAVGFVYSALFGQEPSTFIPRLTIGLIIWGYLTNSIVEGGGAFTNSEGYIKQISLPLYVYIFRAFVSIGLNTLISIMAYAFVAIVYRAPLRWGTLWAVLGLAILMAISLSLIFVFAHLNVRYRDMTHLMAMVMQVAFYVTPVIFPAELIRERGLGWVVDLNPLHHLLEIVRYPLLVGGPASEVNYIVALLSLVILILSAWVIAAYYRQRVVFYL